MFLQGREERQFLNEEESLEKLQIRRKSLKNKFLFHIDSRNFYHSYFAYIVKHKTGKRNRKTARVIIPPIITWERALLSWYLVSVETRQGIKAYNSQYAWV